MARSAFKSTSFAYATGSGIARLIGYVARSTRKVMEPEDLTHRLRAEHPAIIAFWHGQFMMVPLLNAHGAPVKAMVARHGDAQIIGNALSRLGVELIRGAGAGGRRKDRGGAQALREAVRALDEGFSICMTADVPPGPARRVGEGIIMLARLSGRPVIPVAVATSRFIALDTWSRMTINLPHSTLAAVAGEPIRVPRDASPEALQAARNALQQGLDTATERAYALAGADVTRATPPGAMKPGQPPAAPGLGLRIYRGVSRAMQPLAPIWLAERARRGKEDASRRAERYGLATHARPRGPLLWVHAASVGETNAAMPLIRALTAARPDLGILLTTGTLTSATLAARLLEPGCVHQFAPLDAPGYARRFLDHWQPDAAVFIESEIWPNLILASADRGIPIALVNARVSDRSFRRWRRNRGLSLPLFSRLALVLAQNDRLARSFSTLGARDVRVSGNLKIDSPPPPVSLPELERLRAATADRPVLLAASTHPGEDELIAAAHRLVAARHPDLLTIIAPRHPERGPAIATLLERMDLRCVQRSAGALPDAATDVYIADTIGELGTLYALSRIAFIGGSLVPHGGQNPIEAVRLGSAVLTGPHVHNFTDSYRALLGQGGAREVRDAETLAAAVIALIDDPAELDRINSGAQSALAGLSGALAITTEAVLELMPEPGGMRRAG